MDIRKLTLYTNGEKVYMILYTINVQQFLKKD